MHLELFSPAKINLFLRILGKRSDGYHNLASLLQTVSLGDTLRFSLQSHEDVLTCSDSNLRVDSSNLVLKAAALFRQRSGLSVYIKAYLDKIIPYENFIK